MPKSKKNNNPSYKKITVPKTGTKMVPFNSFVDKGTINLTSTKKDILQYLNNGFKVSQIASIKGCRKCYIRKIKRELQKKGLIRDLVPDTGGGYGTTRYQTGTKTLNSSNKKKISEIRLHAQKFRIELINPISENYLKNYIGENFRIDNNFIQCFKKSILIQSKEKSFNSNTEIEAISLSMDYWYNFFIKLENQLKTLLLKDRKQNINMVYYEIATTNCDIARKCEQLGDPIRIYASDRKLRYTTDWSFTHEREAHHNQTALEDSERINLFIKDILEYPENLKISKLINCVGSNTQHITKILTIFDKLLLNTASNQQSTPESEKNDKQKADYFG